MHIQHRMYLLSNVFPSVNPFPFSLYDLKVKSLNEFVILNRWPTESQIGDKLTWWNLCAFRKMYMVDIDTIDCILLLVQQILQTICMEIAHELSRHCIIFVF